LQVAGMLEKNLHQEDTAPYIQQISSKQLFWIYRVNFLIVIRLISHRKISDISKKIIFRFSIEKF
jgi:hypothetical protein